ncbi:MAG: M61 family metallopeptidase [Phycisphaeraceae bacterium]|nr:M61 family metallopeptidase [Phycisphaerales bacterium]MCB9860418.1 M61 family metallopeptidase [Phycisphaeraceae bacterium]
MTPHCFARRIRQSFVVSVLMTLAALSSLATPTRADGPTVHYHVSLNKPQTQTCLITMQIRGIDTDTIDVIMPTWRPGRYEILDFAGTVRSFKAVGGVDTYDYKQLKYSKIRKSAWRIETNGAKEITVWYEIYANSLNTRTRHIDASHAFLSGSAVFMMAPDARDNPCTVYFDMPETWKIATGLEADRSKSNQVKAANYDVLVDSPIELGTFDLIEFEVLDTPHQLAIWSDEPGEPEYDREELIEDFTKIVEHAHDIFGSFPYSRYIFLLHVGNGIGGGTEHLNSTIMQTSHGFSRGNRYNGFLGLVSHEFFHTWNVKQFRPAGITPYDYEKENYTTQLWIAEGTTSYYDDLMLVRAGLIDTSEYFRRIVGGHNYVLNRPGAKVQSLAESSYDAWIKFNASWPDSANTTVSFYTKGAMVSLLLDMEIRASTGNAKSLDDVMHTMYERFPQPGPGYTEADFQGVVEHIAGKPMDSFFEVFVNGTTDLPLVEALQNVGLELARSSDRVEAYVGINANESNGTWKVSSVASDGPAFDAGIVVDDEIVAVNNKRVSGSVNDAIDDLEPGDDVVVTMFRHGELVHVTFPAGSRNTGRWEIKRMNNPTASQVAMYEDWLKLDWPNKPDADTDNDDDQPE